jgi:hypothetical protein
VGQGNLLPAHLAGAHVLAKPYRVEDVERKLRELMAGNARGGAS